MENGVYENCYYCLQKGSQVDGNKKKVVVKETWDIYRNNRMIYIRKAKK